MIDCISLHDVNASSRTAKPGGFAVLPAGWWSVSGSNRRPPACKAGALPAELTPRSRRMWWVEEDLNLRPHAYQACALTT